jgi:hypothetical protein
VKKFHLSGLDRGFFFFLAFINLFFAGCGSSPSLIERYPDFLTRRNEISSISLCTDVLVIYDGTESGVVVDIPLSLIVGDSILKIFETSLTKKNYNVGSVFAPAVGYSLVADTKHRDQKHYKVFQKEEDYSLSMDALGTKAAPFVADDEFLALQDLLSEGNAAALSQDDSSSLEGEYLLYFWLEATNVSTSKIMLEGFLNSFLGISGSPEAYAEGYYQLFDLYTGDVCLSSGWSLKGGSDLNGEKVADLLEDMIAEFPARDVKAP